MPHDLHESIHDEIERRIAALAPVPGALPSKDDAALLSELYEDRDLLRQHWRHRPGGTSDFSQPPNAKDCGQPQPCSHTLGLAEKYGLY
jgi:hypothetical protein